MQTQNSILPLENDSLISSMMTPESMKVLDGSLRLRFWEIEAFFKCPVIGWCLNLAEQREILKKEGMAIKDLSDFEIHEILVDSLQNENRLSRRIDFWLDRKYKKEVKELSSLEQEEFLKYWRNSLRRGEVEGILWAAVTKADISAKVKRSLFGDVHMEMHVRAKQIDNERQGLDQERKRSEFLVKKIDDMTRSNRILRKENETLMNELSKKNQLSETLRRQNVELEKELLKANGNDLIASVHQENIALRHEVKKISEEILAYQRELRILQNQNTKLLSKHQNEQQNHSHLSEEPEEAIDQISNLIEDGNSSQINLSGRCILIVGGLFKMETLYRHLIEENGGIFEYHDGEMNAGIKKLENQVRRADLVLCPLNYNSHAASSVTKRLCKKYQKPLRMLANSSLSTISLTLSSLQNSLSEIQDDQDELSQQIV